MKKSDLKNGYIITTRNGNEYVFLKDFFVNSDYCMRASANGIFLNSQKKSWVLVDDYKDDLTTHEAYSRDLDVMKVEVVEHVYSIMDIKHDRDNRIIIWERKEARQITVAEIEKILGFKVEIVSEK